MSSRRKQKPAQSARDKFFYLYAAMADPDLSAVAKVVLVALVLKFRNNRTSQCNPSMATIAQAVGRDRRNVITAVAALRARGWLTVVSTKGGSARNTNKFVFDLKQRAPVMNSSPVAKTVLTGDESAPRTYNNHSPLRGEGCGVDSASAPAPDGAAPEEGEESAALWKSFQALCQIWRKPDGINVSAAWKHFQVVCGDHPAEQVLASAECWVTATEPRYLKKLEVWLGNGAWRSDPPVRRAEPAVRRRKDDPVEAMMNAGGWERGE
jgi:hypothetical protein